MTKTDSVPGSQILQGTQNVYWVMWETQGENQAQESGDEGGRDDFPEKEHKWLSRKY